MLQGQLAVNSSLQNLCLKYLIGSVAILGKIDECALRTVGKLCNGCSIMYLTDLVNELAKKNDIVKVAQFAANCIGYRRENNAFRNWIAALMRENWSAMENLAMRILEILRGNRVQDSGYCFMMRHLPARRQYEIISAGGAFLGTIENVYPTGGADSLLREIFFLARCSRTPNLQFRRRLANKFPYFGQFLAEDTANVIANLCPGSGPTLSDDALRYISKFMDVETLMFVFPLVCSQWRNLHPILMAQDTRIQSLYLLDLSHNNVENIHTVVPWKHCLRNSTDALRYLEHCIKDGTLGTIELTPNLQDSMRTYMQAVIEGKIPLPTIRDCDTQYAAFLALFETIHNHCSGNWPAMNKPDFLTEEEYGKAIHYFACVKGWGIKLPKLLAEDMPRAFSILEQDRERMHRLIDLNFGNFDEPSIILVMHGQTSGIPETLARLVFSQTRLFKRLVEPMLIQPSRYYEFIIESGILLELAMNSFRIERFSHFMISLILFFKKNQDKIDKIVASMCNMAPGLINLRMWIMKKELGLRCSRILGDTGKYCLEDAEFSRRVMARFEIIYSPGS